MDYAKSLKNGRTYKANHISYEKTRTLQLVCCVCRGKVFKRIRRSPHVSHYFAHYEGGSPNCELYHPATGFRSEFSDQYGESHHQDFWRFAAAVRQDLWLVATDSGLVSPERDQLELSRVREIVSSLTNDFPNRPSSSVETAARHLLEPHVRQLIKKAHSRLELIAGFHRRKQAGFVDTEICALALWINSSFDREIVRSGMERITRHHLALSNLQSIFLVGLVCHHLGLSVSWLAREIRRWASDTFFPPKAINSIQSTPPEVRPQNRSLQPLVPMPSQ